MENITTSMPFKPGNNRKMVLSSLWIFVLFNYLYCDVLTLMDSVQLKQIITGTAGNLQITENFLLIAAIVMEIPIVMILLSRILSYQANRIANILAGTFMTIIQIISLFNGTEPTSYYIFCSIVEITTTVTIVWVAMRWQNSELITVN